MTMLLSNFNMYAILRYHYLKYYKYQCANATPVIVQISLHTICYSHHLNVANSVVWAEFRDLYIIFFPALCFSYSIMEKHAMMYQTARFYLFFLLNIHCVVYINHSHFTLVLHNLFVNCGYIIWHWNIHSYVNTFGK